MITSKALEYVEKCESECKEIFEEIEKVALFNQAKVLDAFRENEINLADIAPSTGYGNDDRARDKLSKIYAKAFGAEDGIVSPLITSGTHALTIGLFGILRPGDIMFSITGKPYDTLMDVIFGENIGSLKDFKVEYQDVEINNDDFDYEAIENFINARHPKMVYIQRSRGYTSRESLSVEKIEKVIKFVKNIDNNILVFVDNCYGEFVDMKEPAEVGADVMVGSLIKNAGGGIAPTGAYIVGKTAAIEQISSRFIAPGIGLEVGSYAGSYTPFFQGAFMAPHITMNALKANILFGKVLGSLGFKSFPQEGSKLNDIVRTIEFGNADDLVNFCRTIQKFSPVDSSAVPFPWAMPGYSDEVIMAAGAFVQGSSIELSADGPLRAPYYGYLQGGLTYEHAKIVACEFVSLKLGL